MIAAFDIGVKNFAFAVKDKNEFVILRNNSLDKESVTKTDLTRLKKENLVELMSNLQISSEKMKKKEMVDIIISKKKKNKYKDVGPALFQLMDDNIHIWDKCEIFLVERQMTVNRQALKLSHYLEAYLKIRYPTKKVLNYSASCKTKKLGAVNLKTKRERKEWTIQYVSKLLKDDNLKYFKSLAKQDDIADVVCMIQSYNLNKK